MRFEYKKLRGEYFAASWQNQNNTRRALHRLVLMFYNVEPRSENKYFEWTLNIL
jgi:hypothetical protein